MRFLIALIGALLLAAPASARSPIDGQWVLAVDRFGTAEYWTLNLEARGSAVSGDRSGAALSGTRRGARIDFTVTDSRGGRFAFAGTVAGARITGTADYPDHNKAGARLTHGFTARRLPDRPPGGPRTHDFAPTDYANAFSADRAPVLTIWPGDTVRTRTIDSGGVDAAGATVALFGNPQTGPFFIAGAEPGDTVIVHILKLTPNRDWADSLDSIVSRALTPALAGKAGDLGKAVRWRLDRAGGFATPEGAVGALAGHRVALRPMLGGLALAPPFGSPPMSTGDTGRAGGNMDFPEVIAGNRVLLPVYQPGGLLYLGDGHALQGDGETSQYALETSLDVEFRVELVKRKAIAMPRVESPGEWMVLGQAGSLDEALRAATSGLVTWLQQDRGLSLSEAAQVIGTSIRYSVPNLAGRSVGVAARIDRAALPTARP
ncbi:acetamidase/formamidase family protein [Sphingomonas sp.]|uniref:acetamidase/formamidase family protein n=1 Tax=Sphingomonas sp. TaxID=28214 RepID=UPI002DD6980A|nr:acetamidase/formamidase family protein [Sphingomonas sp.]